MSRQFAIGYLALCSRRALRFLPASLLLFLASQAFAQSYVGRFEVYEGYMYLDSPHVSLAEPGYHIQAGLRKSTRISLGFDYSRGTGDLSMTSNLLTTALQQQFNSAISSGVLPANYRLAVPMRASTQTFTMGPQFPYRRFNKVTPFVRPSVGALKEVATVRPTDFLTHLIVGTITPTGRLEEWTAFYGFGGGVALNFSRHFSLVVQADFVHDHLFNDILKDGRNTVRLSIGPGFQFGKNVRK